MKLSSRYFSQTGRIRENVPLIYLPGFVRGRTLEKVILL